MEQLSLTNMLLNIWFHRKGKDILKQNKLHQKQSMFLHNCTFLHTLARYLLLNMLLLSSVVRAMQGMKVMPGSMALDKDLGKAEQDTRQTNSQ